MDAEERESASSLRQKILAPHVAKRQLLSLVTNNPLPSAEKLSEATEKLSEGTDILKYTPHARTKNSTFVCETDGSDEGPVSELQRITSPDVASRSDWQPKIEQLQKASYNSVS